MLDLEYNFLSDEVQLCKSAKVIFLSGDKEQRKIQQRLPVRLKRCGSCLPSYISTMAKVIFVDFLYLV